MLDKLLDKLSQPCIQELFFQCFSSQDDNGFLKDPFVKCIGKTDPSDPLKRANV